MSIDNVNTVIIPFIVADSLFYFLNKTATEPDVTTMAAYAVYNGNKIHKLTWEA